MRFLPNGFQYTRPIIQVSFVEIDPPLHPLDANSLASLNLGTDIHIPEGQCTVQPNEHQDIPFPGRWIGHPPRQATCHAPTLLMWLHQSKRKGSATHWLPPTSVIVKLWIGIPKDLALPFKLLQKAASPRRRRRTLRSCQIQGRWTSSWQVR